MAAFVPHSIELEKKALVGQISTRSVYSGLDLLDFVGEPSYTERGPAGQTDRRARAALKGRATFGEGWRPKVAAAEEKSGS